MGQISTELSFFQNTRRWPRYQADLEIRIVAVNGIRRSSVLARGSEISRAGLALRATIDVNTGDLIQLQFPTSKHVIAAVRDRSGDCLGLEFLTQPSADNKEQDGSTFLPAPVPVMGGLSELAGSARNVESCTPQTLCAGLHRKQGELRKLLTEIEALKLAILLLADDENEPSRLSPPNGPTSVSAVNPWPRCFEDSNKSKANPRAIKLNSAANFDRSCNVRP
jgi:hypothetical protein